MNCLIFGCGYLGQRVAMAWKQRGYTVHAMTRCVERAQSFRHAGFVPVIGDICEPRTLTDLPTVDVVLHAVGFDRNAGRTQEEVTLEGMRHVLTAIQGNCEKFIQISSTSVYGQSDGEWIDEESTCVPVQLGGQLALAAERLVHESFGESQNGRAITLRLAGIYGPGRLLSRMELLKNGAALTGRGDAWLNLIHVDDAVRAVIACAEQQSRSATYIVVDDEPLLREAYFGTLAKLIAAPPPTFDAMQPSSRGSGGLNKRCSNRKLRRELNWIPEYPSIESGLPASLGQTNGPTASCG